MNLNKILVLNYHLVSRESMTGPVPLNSRFTISEQAFVGHMSLVKRLGIPVVSLDQVASAVYEHEFAIALSFDDGNSSDYDIVLPLLRQLSFPAAFFPVGNNIGSAGKVNWKQLADMSADHIIGSHGMAHTALPALSCRQKMHELLDSKLLLAEKLCIPVKFFALPYGMYDKEILQLAGEAGYSSILSTFPHPNSEPHKHAVIHRYNVKSNTSLEILNKILISGGRIPFRQICFTKLAGYGKRVLGQKLTLKLGSLIYQYTK